MKIYLKVFFHKLHFLCVIAMLLYSSSATCDQFHYNNIIIGDRAIGLGGAFTAISDDSSGVFYNPAGLGFALNNDISGSANAFFRRTIVYKETIGDQDFQENSRGSVPSFFGGLQKLDNIAEGLVAAFAVYTTDSETKDEDTVVEGVTLPNGVQLTRLHRTVNSRASTNYFGAAVGGRLLPNLSLGFGFSVFLVDELFQDYQDVQSRIACPSDDDGNSNADRACQQVLAQNIRTSLTATGIEPVFGVQWSPINELSFGLTLKQAFLVSDLLEKSTDFTRFFIDELSGQPLENRRVDRAVIEPKDLEGTTENALKEWPLELRVGAAWFANTRLLFSSDIVYRGAAEGEGEDQAYKRLAVTNYAFGAEYFLTPAVPLRLGFFTNKDARPEIDKNKPGQPDHIDYVGGSVFVGWVQPNSQISVGTVLQSGDGEAQKTGDFSVQKVEASTTTFAFSASHNF